MAQYKGSRRLRGLIDDAGHNLNASERKLVAGADKFVDGVTMRTSEYLHKLKQSKKDVRQNTLLVNKIFEVLTVRL